MSTIPPPSEADLKRDVLCAYCETTHHYGGNGDTWLADAAAPEQLSISDGHKIHIQRCRKCGAIVAITVHEFNYGCSSFVADMRPI